MWRQTRRQWKRKPWISETSAGSWQLPRAYIRGACQCIYFIFFFSFSLVFVERGGKTQNWPRAAKRLEPAQSETMLAVEPTGVVSFCLFQWRHDKMDCWRRSNTNCSVSPTLLRTKQSLEIQTVLASYLNFLLKSVKLWDEIQKYLDYQDKIFRDVPCIETLFMCASVYSNVVHTFIW